VKEKQMDFQTTFLLKNNYTAVVTETGVLVYDCIDRLILDASDIAESGKVRVYDA
jgi:hypothetical protein